MGILKMAKELSILCDIDLVLIMFSPSGYPSMHTGKHSFGEVIAKVAQLDPLERATRILENLEILFRKHHQDINISEFLDRSKPRLEVLSEKVRFLQTQLLEIDTKLSYWNDVAKIDSIDDLLKREKSLRQSLCQIRAHKESLLQHQHQQLMSTQCKTQKQSDIDIDFGMDMEQNMKIPIKEEDPDLQFYHTYMDKTCSTSSSLQSYSGLIGKNSDIKTPKLESL